MGGDLALGLGGDQKSIRYCILRLFEQNFRMTFLDKNFQFLHSFYHQQFLMTFLSHFIVSNVLCMKYNNDRPLGGWLIMI